MNALQCLWFSSPEERAIGTETIAGTDSPALSHPRKHSQEAKAVDLTKKPKLFFQP